MNQAARALSEISQALNFNKGLLPLEPYEGLDTPHSSSIRIRFPGLLFIHANDHAPSAIILSQAKMSTWQQMLTGLETVNRLRHPNVGEAYIKWRSQSMLVRRLWEDAKFPGVDPDPFYTQIRRKYCTAVKRLINEKAEQGEDDIGALIFLNETYNKKLMLARKLEVSTESFSDRIRAIQAKKAQESQEAEKRTKEIEAEEEREEMMEQGGDDEFVVVEVEDADDEEFGWENDDWDML
ncbi:hypothetical protein H4I96_04900 [Botrytis cinerea]